MVMSGTDRSRKSRALLKAGVQLGDPRAIAKYKLSLEKKKMVMKQIRARNVQQRSGDPLGLKTAIEIWTEAELFPPGARGDAARSILQPYTAVEIAVAYNAGYQHGIIFNKNQCEAYWESNAQGPVEIPLQANAPDWTVLFQKFAALKIKVTPDMMEKCKKAWNEGNLHGSSFTRIAFDKPDEQELQYLSAGNEYVQSLLDGGGLTYAEDFQNMLVSQQGAASQCEDSSTNIFQVGHELGVDFEKQLQEHITRYTIQDRDHIKKA